MEGAFVCDLCEERAKISHDGKPINTSCVTLTDGKVSFEFQVVVFTSFYVLWLRNAVFDIITVY